MFHTRRDFLCASSGVLAFFPPTGLAAEAWVEKKPGEWSPKDIQTILNQSPWAREARLEMNAPTASPGGMPGGQREIGGMPAEFKVLVRWESGLPIRLARKNISPPNNPPGQYVLSISRLPTAYIAIASGGNRGRGAEKDPSRAELAERIAQSTTLQREGKDPISANHAEWAEDDFSPRMMIFFPLPRQPIRLEDREVGLICQIGAFVVRARFSLKRMVYRGALEL
jgi:hypothetical protein